MSSQKSISVNTIDSFLKKSIADNSIDIQKVSEILNKLVLTSLLNRNCKLGEHFPDLDFWIGKCQTHFGSSRLAILSYRAELGNKRPCSLEVEFHEYRIVVLFRIAAKGWIGTRNVQYTSNRIGLYIICVM